MRDRRYALGGAGNVAQNVRAVGARAISSRRLATTSAAANSARCSARSRPRLGSLVTVDRPTTTKTRIVARSQQVVRVDEEEDADLEGDEVIACSRPCGIAVAKADALVLEDYNKGVLVPRVIEAAMAGRA